MKKFVTLLVVALVFSVVSQDKSKTPEKKKSAEEAAAEAKKKAEELAAKKKRSEGMIKAISKEEMTLIKESVKDGEKEWQRIYKYVIVPQVEKIDKAVPKIEKNAARYKALAQNAKTKKIKGYFIDIQP